MTRLRVNALLASLVLGAGLMGPIRAAAPRSVEAEVSALRARAANQAQAGKWELAIHTLSKARERVQTARREALRRAALPPPNPEFQQKMKALQTWYVGQMKQVTAGKKDRQTVIREFQSRQEALLRKYPRKSTAPASASTAKLDLLLASLNDTAAVYNSRRGKPRAAVSQRQRALIGRLQALRAQGQPDQAAAVAEKLLKEAPRDPEAISEVGQFFQERKQFSRAATTWEAGIQALESGQADLAKVGMRRDRNQVRKRYLTQFYRQVAFCYSQLGRGSDAKRAMAKAAQAEAALGASTLHR